MSKGSEFRKKSRKIESLKKFSKGLVYASATLVGLYFLSQVPYVKRAINNNQTYEKYLRAPTIEYTVQKGDIIDKLLINEGVPKKELNSARSAMSYMNSGMDDFVKPINLNKIVEGDKITAIDYNHNGVFGK